MEQEKINRLQWILDDAVARGEIPGAILMVRKEGKETVYLESGYADIEAKKPVSRDSIYRLYSMSKPITATAVMILVERGLIDLADPVCRYLPGFCGQMVAAADGHVEKPWRDVTIQDLVNMTSGLVYDGNHLTGKQTVVTLTRKNAYRVKKIREQGTDNEAVLFHFRKRCTGMGSYVHTIETADGETELHPNEFEKWEAVEFLYPGYLEDLLDAAYNAYRWSSFEPEARAETDIMQYEKQLVEDLKLIPEEKQNEYVSAYHSKFSALLGCLSRCASPMVTGPAKFNCQRNNKALDAYQNRFDEFHDWRNRFKAAMERMKEAAKPEEQKQEEAWNRLKRDIASSAQTIHDIDTGKARGYSRALFVSSILNKVSTYAGKGEVEIVQKAVDFITDFNAQCKKPVITPRNRFFQLLEMARQARLKLQEIRERENRELKFEGGTLVWNYEADRLQILFDSIPDDQRRKELKSYGFKWSPRYQAWQRQLTQNAVYAVKRVLNLQNL